MRYCCSGAIAALKAQKADAKGNPYLEYAIDKQLAFLSNPENISFEELELPDIIKVGHVYVSVWLKQLAGSDVSRGCIA